MTVLLESPHRFKERLLLYGGGGTGKSTAALSICQHLARGTMHVIDNDYSLSYERALATDFDDIDPNRIQITEIEPEWEASIEALEKVTTDADPDDDWIVIDLFSPWWEYVQSWMSREVHGKDLHEMMTNLRSEANSVKDFNAELSESMAWPVINRTFTDEVYRRIRRWRGHMVLVCEGKEVSRRNDDAEIQSVFGHLGVRPAGQKLTHHICATNLLFTKTDHGEIRFTTAKDRNREEHDRVTFDDFALDYLVEVAGWQRARKG